MAIKPPSVLIVDDNETVLFAYSQSLSKCGYSVETATTLADAKKMIVSITFDALVLDLKLPDGNALEWIPELKRDFPDLPIIVVTGFGDIPTAVAAIKCGAENFLTKPVEPDGLELSLAKVLELGNLRKKGRIKQRLEKLAEPFFGKGTAILPVVKMLHVAASTESVLLFLGETGTGKGVLAKWTHQNSSRSKEAFVELNCSCIKGDLLRSELFGHAKGSFTSAISDREGLIEIADKGTLFLDEIGDMDLTVQTQLLKVIEEKTFRRVGDNRLRKSDFRLICATNKDLLKEAEAGTFRKDLYYRICVFPITIPPLKEREEDIAQLAEFFLLQFGRSDVVLAPEIVDILKKYSWPGNIRELRNVIERALLLSHNDEFTLDCFPGLEMAKMTMAADSELPVGLRAIELEYLRTVVQSCNGDKKLASKMLGISLATIYRKLGQTSSPGEAANL